MKRKKNLHSMLKNHQVRKKLPDFPVARNMHEALYILDYAFTFVHANQKVLKLWKKRRNEVLGKNIWDVFPEAVGSESYKRHYEAIKKNKQQHFEASSPVLGKWLEVTIIPIDSAYLLVYFHDISERKELEFRLAERAELIQLSSDAFIVQDQDNKITFWSRGAERIYGYSRQEALGKIAYKLLQTEFSSSLSAIQDQLKTETVWQGELVHTTSKGKKIVVESRWTLIENHAYEGKYTFLEVNTNITKRKKLEQQRENFISFATHELNAPLAALKVFNHLLQKRLEKTGDSEGLKLLHKASAQVFKMTDLVSYLLDDTRVQTGKLQVYKDKFNLSELVREAVDTIGRTNGTHRITLSTPDNTFVNGDRQRIQQVLVNLISNGIKYSPRGEEIHVKVESRKSDFLFSIRDFGTGIAKKDIKNVFERFYQSEDMSEKKAQGLGLGLYISREIIRKHNGRIWVESEKGQGSTFYFTLPRNERES